MRTSGHTGRHARRKAAAVPVTHFLTATTALAPRPHCTGPAASTTRRGALPLAAATAMALAFTPAIAQHEPARHLPTVSTPAIQLSALVDPAGITALQKKVNAELANLDSAVAAIVGAPGQTLGSAMSAASSLTSTFWDALNAAAGDNPLLTDALTSLKNLTSGGLTALARTVTTANNDLVLSTKQVSTLITSTLTGAAATAALALSGALVNPFSLTGLATVVDAPFTIGGQVVNSVITAAADLGDTAIGFVGGLVTTATTQINNVLTAVTHLMSGIGTSSGSNIIAGLITAAQSVVSSPLTALLAGVSGGATTLTGAATAALDVIGGAAHDLNNIWLGGNTGAGTVQAVIDEIAAGPLDVDHYVAALTTLTQAAITTITKPVTTVIAGLATVPFTAGAALVNTGAQVIASLVNGVTGLAAGLGQIAGLPSGLIGTIWTVGKTVKASISLAAKTVAAGLNTAATLIGAITHSAGLVTPAATAVPTTTSKLVAVAATKTTGTSPAASAKPATGSTALGMATTVTPAHNTSDRNGRHASPTGSAPDSSQPAHTTPNSTTSTTTAGGHGQNKHAHGNTSIAKTSSRPGKHAAGHHGGAHA